MKSKDYIKGKGTKASVKANSAKYWTSNAYWMQKNYNGWKRSKKPMQSNDVVMWSHRKHKPIMAK